MKLSIIIPCYNSEPYIDELLKCLAPQLTDEVEVIVIDDGSDFPFLSPFPGIKVYRKENGGVSSARNVGLDKAIGDYIVFIDADDLVSKDYISEIFKAMESAPDTIYLSWKSMHGKWGKTLRDDLDEFGPANRCVWNRVFKRTYIEGMRFNESKQIAEDDDFLNRLPAAKSKKCITHTVYFYRQNRKGSLTYRKAMGEFEEPDIITQVVFYYNWIQQIGGVETFFYNFCKKMSKYYDITILYDRFDMVQLARLQKMVQCVKNGEYVIQCDTLIVNGIFDKMPEKVRAKQKIRLVHTCRIERYGIVSVPNDCDKKIFVSEASRKSFAEDGDIIQNLPGEVNDEKALILLSATRLTSEKGYDRMLKLAEKFKKYDIPFIWLVFTSKNDKVFPDGFIKLPPTLNIMPYIKKCDYVVQLSDVEAFCYTIQEALQLNRPVLTTPIDVLPEVGVKDGENGYVIPFNIDEMKESDILRLYKYIPRFDNWQDNTKDIIKKWRKILGNTKPTHSYIFDDTKKTIRCKCTRFHDVVLDKAFYKDQIQTTNIDRAKQLVEQGYWEYI